MHKLIHIALLAGILCPGPADADVGKSPHINATVVYDNYTHAEDLQADWGFACLIQGTEKTILFDTGTQGDVLLGNMDKLTLDPCCVEIVVISHFHRDHTGGLDAFLDQNPDITVYAPAPKREAFVQRVEARGAKVVWVDKPRALCRDVWLTGPMGDRIIEQSLVLDTEKGSVVVTGCSHPGIVQILYKSKAILDRPIYMAFGGFHLLRHSKADLEEVIRQFRKLGVVHPGPTHCTGDEAIARFKEAYGDDCLTLGVGRVVPLPKRTAEDGARSARTPPNNRDWTVHRVAPKVRDSQS